MPINRAKAMLEDFRVGKSFGRPRFGASTVYITGDLATELKLPESGGLLIQEIGRGSAAEMAGLKGYRDVVQVGNERLGIGGDFITAVDGKPVTESDELARAIARKRPGDTITVKIFRAGKTLDVPVKLGEVPEQRF